MTAQHTSPEFTDDAQLVDRRDRRRTIRKWAIIGAGFAVLMLIIGVSTPTEDEGQVTPYAELEGQKVILSTSRATDNRPIVWAFNFAEDVNVTPVQEVINAVVGIDFSNPVVQLKGGMSIYNPVMEKQISSSADTTQPIQLVYGLPALNNVAGTYEDQRETTLLVTVHPKRPIYAYSDQKNWGRPPSFVEQVERLTQFECLPDGEAAPGIQRYREPTEVEAAQIVVDHKRRGPRYQSKNGCIDPLAVRGAVYVVRDDADAIRGLGKCISFHANEASANCHFTFLRSGHLLVEYRFSETHVAMMGDIDRVVRAERRSATVASASQNVPFH